MGEVAPEYLYGSSSPLYQSTYPSPNPLLNLLTCRAMESPEPGFIHVITMNTNPKMDITTPVTMKHGSSNQPAGVQGEAANPQEAWLPITESRNGNTIACMFHVLSSGIGFQALLLPVALSTLGWTWGMLCLAICFMWQLYTVWVLVNLHESDSGTRFSRYLQLAVASFGPKLGKFLCIFPVMYLSGGTCVILIINGGRALKLFFATVCEDGATCNSNALNGVEWFLVFACTAIIIAQLLPNMNSVAGVSVLGAVTALGYGTLIWVLSVHKGRPGRVSYDTQVDGDSNWARICEVLNAIGMIALAFRGHNLILEIQGTLPSKPKYSPKTPMWRAVIIAYSVIALYLCALAIGGFWAYGNKISSEGLLYAFAEFHGNDTSKSVLGLIYILFIINCLCTFQIYAMPVFDNLEIRYIGIVKHRCSRWARAILRLFFGGLAFFIAVAFPFLGSLAPLIGGLTSPLTYTYPCFMWVAIKNPHRRSRWLNVGLGCLGLKMATLLVVAALWALIDKGLNANFFKPQLR